MARHQLLVTLDVKPEAFGGYVAAMRREETGARSEAGNLGFDLWGEGGRPSVFWLREYWASESALAVDHAVQPYYRHVRGMEGEALTGQFEERLLVEQGQAAHQTPGSGKSLNATRLHVTVWPTAPAGLVAAFDQSAGAVRAASGNRFWQLYANPRKPGEMVLLHAWDNGATPKPWAQLPEGASLRALITQSATHTVELQKI